MCVCLCLCAFFLCVCSASAVLVGPLRLLIQLWPLLGSGDGRVVVIQSLCHPLTDDVHQPLERLLHVDVVFRTGFKELESC